MLLLLAPESLCKMEIMKNLLQRVFVKIEVDVCKVPRIYRDCVFVS